ncbi:GLPGLI family protein [Flavilitoribacter nigricans]|uniref:GLPGLI family protein n=1 Tax=Flavilitoribacter nigricans (strain ATCC 23147 / DSM 23189 / NBRC 102662 / NCIMB 1420 / SS-2) TaxID=1122177 RepID=A0A2D0N9K8_FLAN2|nr:GLPGLI family protein [Flavilitoribacter nigricans]PHN05068.1 hypothetical protein CRP01_18765 [Flavilitoribacter nigricans DSM 23189 = NBRC 102662]
MKKSILLLPLLILVSFWLPAQNAGKIIYEQRINLHKRLGEENAQMKAMLPEWQEWKTQLVFKDQASLYQNYEDEETDGSINASSGGMRIQLQRPESITYHDLQGKKRIQQEEFMQKRYLITEEIPKSSWKITGEQREILGYNCQQAVLQEETAEGEETREVVAWFTPEIPLAAGPGAYGQLPGLILVIDIDSGTSTIEAKSVDLTAKVSDKDIEAPSKGKEMTREEFRQEQEKIMQEMNHGGGRGMRIRF